MLARFSSSGEPDVSPSWHRRSKVSGSLSSGFKVPFEPTSTYRKRSRTKQLNNMHWQKPMNWVSCRGDWNFSHYYIYYYIIACIFHAQKDYFHPFVLSLKQFNKDLFARFIVTRFRSYFKESCFSENPQKSMRFSFVLTQSQHFHWNSPFQKKTLSICQ